MIERLKNDLKRIGVSEDIINSSSFEYVFSELVELYYKFQTGTITLKSTGFGYNIEFETDDDLVIVSAQYIAESSRVKLDIHDGKSIVVTCDKEEDELLKYASEKTDDISTVETSIYSLSNGLEKKYVRDSSGHKDGGTYYSLTRLERMDNGYIGEIYKTESPDGKGLSGYVNVDLSSPLLLDGNKERFEDVSTLSGETVKNGLSVPDDSTISPEARQLIETKLAEYDADWEYKYKNGIEVNTFAENNTVKL